LPDFRAFQEPGCTVPIEALDCRSQPEKGKINVAVARVTEISASSEKSFEDAIRHGIDRASKTLRNVEGAWVKEQKVCVKDGKITEFRVNMQVTFILEG
jgi:flavin-binding protein dodecin